jgi:nucleotide-binding universal stress UspA family protein
MKHLPFHIKMILFPTDFSKSSESAASHVAGLARAIQAKVCLLNVVPWLPSWHGVSEPHFVVSDDALRVLESDTKVAEASCLKTLETVKSQRFADVECECCIRIGGVAESVVDCVQEIHADLIMMPTRGFGSPRSFLIGSVTAKVLHDARCAVWTSPHPAELGPFRPYRQIIFAIDYRHLSLNLLARASEVAHLFQSRLSLVSAIPCPGGDPVAHVRKSIHLLKDETVSALRDQLRHLAIEAPLHVLEGSVGDVIRRAAAMEDADLVVIGRGHLDEQMGHLRTHAYEIIWNSPCPVLSL